MGHYHPKNWLEPFPPGYLKLLFNFYIMNKFLLITDWTKMSKFVPKWEGKTTKYLGLINLTLVKLIILL